MEKIEELSELLADKADAVSCGRVVDIEAPTRIRWAEAQINALQEGDWYEWEVRLIIDLIRANIEDIKTTHG